MANVVAVSLRAGHHFSKTPSPSIRLLRGLGVAGDAHMGETVKHRSRVRKDPTQPNLRQVHLIHAELHEELDIPHAQLVLRKGYRQHVDSYSAFCEADGKTSTGLAGYLRDRGLEHVVLVGLATDFCVAWSAFDARRRGFHATVVEDACRAIDTGGSLAKAWREMAAAGVRRIVAADVTL